MAAASGNGDGENNQRVTNAKLSMQIEHLAATVAEGFTRMEHCWEQAREERREAERRIAQLEMGQARLDERLSTSNKILGSVQALVAAALAALGVMSSK